MSARSPYTSIDQNFPLICSRDQPAQTRSLRSVARCLPMPDAIRSVRVLVETAPALDAEAALVSVLVQELARALRNAIAHGGVVLFDGKHDIEADAIHEAKRRDARGGEDLPHGV